MRRAKTIRKTLNPSLDDSSSIIFKALSNNIIRVKKMFDTQKIRPKTEQIFSESESFTFTETLIHKSEEFQMKKESLSPTFFTDLQQLDEPKVLWIGGADSRVDPSQILNNPFGSIMIQRNTANQINLENPNVMAVIEQAVILKQVEYIVVCGQTNCAGVQAACGPTDHLDEHFIKFLSPLRELFETVSENVENDSMDVLESMCRENVHLQIRNLMKLDFVKDAVEAGRLTLIPLIFDMKKGQLDQI